MFGLFDLFGRSAEIKALDQALREAGVHPALVPEAVKLTIVKLHKTDAAAADARDAGFKYAAQLFAYCLLGREPFIANNGADAADRAENRVEAAIAAGDSFDAKLILLALHSGLLDRDIADRLEAESD